MIWGRWFIGLTFATGLVWITGPFFLDSILVREFNPSLARVTLAPGQRILWRSEGWGTSHVGVLGTPGSPLHLQPKDPVRPRIILWGDSQVEGLCVSDRFKLSNLLMDWFKEAGLEVDVVPLGRSGADASDWSAEMPSAVSLIKPDLHLWFVAEFEDLIALTKKANRQEPRASPKAIRFLANVRGEAFFHAAKNVLLEPSTTRLRKLRWQVGPVTMGSPGEEGPSEDPSNPTIIPNLLSQLKVVQSQAQAPIAIVYAPAVPIISGRVVEEDPHAKSVEHLKAALDLEGIDLIDLTSDLRAHYHQTGQLPRGFHNGFPGLGHFNAAANRALAGAVGRELLASPWAAALVKGAP